MAEVILNNSNRKVETLVAEIKGKKYSIPLAGSLPYGVLKKLKTGDNMVEFFKKYIPEEVFDELYPDEIEQISKAWSDATWKAQGLNPGE